mgnify:FL=1
MDRPSPTPRARTRRLVACVAVALGMLPVGPASGAEPADRPWPVDASSTGVGDQAEPDDGELPPLGELPDISPDLAAVQVQSATHDAAVAERDRVRSDLTAATELETAKAGEILELTLRERELTEQIDAARTAAEHWESEMDRLGGELRQVAVSAYVSGTGRELSPLFALDTSTLDDLATASVTAGALADRQLSQLDRATRNAITRRNEEQLATAVREGVRDALAEAERVRVQAADDRERLTGELMVAEATVEEERRLATVEGADFPLVVLDAYLKAARLMELLAPGCDISWWALAGIGRIESRHGTYGGAEVRADGSLTEPIIGIPLTGAMGTAHIRDSDGGRIDGDPVYDRATGPMQFIPQTWARWGLDADGDGEANSQNLYDAAAAAAAYLCASGSMRDDAGLERGYFSYNHSGFYVFAVLTAAHDYRDSVSIPPPS